MTEEYAKPRYTRNYVVTVYGQGRYDGCHRVVTTSAVAAIDIARRFMGRGGDFNYTQSEQNDPCEWARDNASTQFDRDGRSGCWAVREVPSTRRAAQSINHYA
jgi:hypothetical protein